MLGVVEGAFVGGARAVRIAEALERVGAGDVIEMIGFEFGSRQRVERRGAGLRTLRVRDRDRAVEARDR